MLLEVLKSKIHKATVTDANVDYVGSITIDEDIMDAAKLVENEKVLVGDLTNGNRLETYVIKGVRGSGTIGMNGAAARLCMVGDEVLVMSFAWMDEKELKTHRPAIVLLDKKNRLQ